MPEKDKEQAAKKQEKIEKKKEEIKASVGAASKEKEGAAKKEVQKGKEEKPEKLEEKAEEIEEEDPEAQKPKAKPEVKGPGLLSRMSTNCKLRFQVARETVRSKIPTMPTIRRPTIPSMSEVRLSIASRMPTMPAMPNVSQYLPEMPSAPTIPLPEPLDYLKIRLYYLDERYVSPLVNRINYLTIILSLLAISSSTFSDLLVFQPKLILNLQNSDGQLQVPHLWTLVTSLFVETSFAFLVLHLLTINYIAI